ncbi:recombinase family protein [Brevibacillus brevis]|uniref:recombinase family protein n=1 Tax=Brevibacillus brevis TaxID=1393 RepID=UPI000D0F3A3F|nr:recombinase family protein [Brevibacillus brevis]PSJ67473.1 hypothetical protein C7J99_21000 [Brevibacillus brevis]RED28462.1 DNA invertase Pin-like site-specific DNA recombinase [Brevibacillus brevis]GEC90716.1 resolvase homolog YokA [Brevibacillus brevis]VEF91157.1 Recombinase [Brevibacillus brevis]
MSLPTTVETIIGYIRRSRQDLLREKKTNQDTLAEQHELISGILKRYEKEHGVHTELLSEIESGDSIEGRKEFKKLLEFLKKVSPRTVAVCVKELSRLGRGSMEEMGIITNILKRKHVYIITPYRVYDPQNKDDARMIDFYLFMARMEFLSIKERMVESRYTYAAMGRHMGGSSAIPYGYKLNERTQKLEPDERTAWVVQKIFHHYVVDKVGYNGISTILKKEGIPSPGGRGYWHPQTIRRILINRAYIGTLEFKKTYRQPEKNAEGKTIMKVYERAEHEQIIVPNAWEPIIDEDTFNKAQEILTGRRNSPTTRLDFEPNPLASLVICSTCNKKMIRQSGTQKYPKKDGTFSVYQKEFLMCKDCHIYVKYKSVEEEIIRILQEECIEVDPDILKERLKDLTDFSSIKKQDYDPAKQIEKLRAEIERHKDGLGNAGYKNTMGMMNDQVYELTVARLMREIEQKELYIEQLLAELQEEHTEGLDMDEVQFRFKTVLEYYLNGDFSKGEKNELLRGVFDYIVLEFISKGKFNLHVMFNPKMFFNATLH